MAVPAHDERDHAFAERYGLEIRPVVRPADGEARGRRGFVAHTDERGAGQLGPSSAACRARRRRRRSSRGSPSAALGEATIGYRLRDWLLSRQRYWGCPIPIVHCERLRRGPGARTTSCRSCCPTSRSTCRRAARRSPRPRTGSTSTARAAAARRGARRTRWTRSSTRPGTSSATPTRSNDEAPFVARDRRLLAAGQPVHRRHRARDPAPALRALLHEGDERAGPRRLPRAVRAALQPGDDPQRTAPRCRSRRATSSTRSTYADRYGADTVRMYTLFMGPADQDMEWQDTGIEGVWRFLQPALARRARAGGRSRRVEQPVTARWRGRRTRRSRR